MIRKPLALIDLADIEDLARQGMAESTTLEFKAQPIANALELARDVSAMCNGEGGDLILGVPEVNGIAQPPTPFPNGEAEARRVVQIVAAGVSPPLRAIATQFITSPKGDVVVVRIPRSRIPTMVHLQGRTEFWVRRDRQRVVMAHSEIVDRVRIGLQEATERTAFINAPIHQFVRQLPGSLGVLFAVTLDAPPDPLIIPVRENAVHSVMQDASKDTRCLVWGVHAAPSLDGLDGMEGGYTFEIHRTGHVEVRHLNANELLQDSRPIPIPPGTRPLDGYVLAASVVEIVRRARRVFEIAGVYDPCTVTVSLGNAKNTLLPKGTGDIGKPWQSDLLVVQTTGYSDDPNDLPARRLCDRLWQAYGYWDCPLFDQHSQFMSWPP